MKIKLPKQEECSDYDDYNTCEYCYGKGYDPMNPHATGGQWGESGANFQNPCPVCKGSGIKNK